VLLEHVVRHRLNCFLNIVQQPQSLVTLHRVIRICKANTEKDQLTSQAAKTSQQNLLMLKNKLEVPCGTDGRRLLSGFQAVVILTLTLDRVIPSCISHRPLSTYQISLKSEKLFSGWTDVPTDRYFRPPLMFSGRLRGVNLLK